MSSVVVDAASLRNLCLVSHQTLLPARRTLYKQSFKDFLRTVDWSQATSLLDAFEARGNYLGRLVRETLGIEHWLHHWRLKAYPSGSADEMIERASRWYLGVLRACLELQRVDFTFSTKHVLDEQLHALALVPSASQDKYPNGSDPQVSSCHLRTVSFNHGVSNPAQQPDIGYPEVLTALQQTTLQSLDTVRFFNVMWQMDANSTTSTLKFPFSPRRLEIYSTYVDLESCVPFFPSDPNNLGCFQIYGQARVDGSDLLQLPKITGSRLRDLSLFFYGWLYLVELPDYTISSHSPRLRPQMFKSYPSLTSLTLQNTHGPSLALLEILSQSCPLLINLSFQGSRWICDSFPDSDYIDQIFPESQISLVLHTLQNLRKLHLGYLPTTDQLEYEGFKKELEKAGMKVEYEICGTGEEIWELGN